MKHLALFLLLLPNPLWADEDKNAAPPSAQVLRTALQWMESGDPDRRQAAYRSVHLLGKEALPSFTAALRKALRYHTQRLSSLLNERGNPYLKLEPLAEELTPERERVYTLIKTDFEKDSAKVRILRDEFESVERLYQQATRITKSDPSDFDAKVDAIAAAMKPAPRASGKKAGARKASASKKPITKKITPRKKKS